MPSSRPKSLYWQGLQAGSPFLLVVAPFAVVFGVVATEAGLSVVQTFGFSLLVIGGASQFAALQMMVENAPVGIVVATALAVNLRMAMYSASLVPYLGAAPMWKRVFISYFNVDQTYAISVAKFEGVPTLNLGDRTAFFFGVATPIFPTWCGMTLVGALMGQQIPPEWSLEFAVPIAFLAVIAPMLKSLAHVAAALTSVVLALALVSLPLNTGLLVAGVVAMVVGAGIETLMARRRT
ncbi:MAG: branched-chain amino acid ABC transporter permease [Rhodobacteraceae bacterium]|nr:AzlC family ABC transporter permease [Alphaproteobacteria bacterium]MBT8476350.1 AzlC family ABC transporter permease [Alphaproteobacteria bacterium]NNF72836.1 branched-chain amino acid ABC transporter permease [Paracoccaceae bacterium]NNK68161.1 branched-chain amino acid ABC transporter permease [Paracoccaceae bacterium]